MTIRSKRVDDIVRGCKDRMIVTCLEEIEASGLSPIAFFRIGTKAQSALERDLAAIIEGYARLDESVLSLLSERHRGRLEQIAAETEAAMSTILDVEQRRTLDSVGFRAILASVDYPALAEFFCRMNGLPAPGVNEGDYSGLFCSKPFEYAEISEGGRTFLCCPLQVPQAVGSTSDGTFMDVWNSEQAQAIRRSILDGSFSRCIERTCPALQARNLPRREDVTDPFLRAVIDGNLTRLDRGPLTLFMNYDRSCNLACPSCRTDLVVLKGRDRREAQTVQEWATGEHLRDARYLHITGSGDAFGSHLFHTFLREFKGSARPELRISIGTNGLLLTEQTWEKICHDSIDIVVISIDAASPETYRLNRGGDFDRLCHNLRFVGDLRATNRIKVFGMNFVVQENNFEEMPAFVELGSSVGVDAVCFQQLTNWGTYSFGEFRQRAVHRAEHPRHAEFLRVLTDARLSGPRVDLSNLAGLRAIALDGVVGSSESRIPAGTGS